MWKYAIAWAPMVVLAIINGLFRERVLSEKLAELHAHQVSTVTAFLLFGIYIWLVIRFCRPESGRRALVIGFMWLFLTVAFEFLFGHYVAGHSWSRLLHDYNILAGRVWVFILIWVTLAPLIFYKLQQ